MAATHPPPPPPVYQQPSAPPQDSYPPAFGAVATPVRKPMTFSLSDALRDGAAGIFLLATLGMPWALDNEYFPWGKGGNFWWVLLSVLLSLVSLVVPYLARARVVPTWHERHYWLLRLGLNAPLVLSVLAVIVIELIHAGDDGTSFGAIYEVGGFVGTGVAFALTGVAFAVQPRLGDSSRGPREDEAWMRAARLSVIAAMVWIPLQFVVWLVHAVATGEEIFDPASTVLLLLVGLLGMPLAVLVWPALGVVRPSRPTAESIAPRRVFVVSAASTLVGALLALASDGDGLFTWPAVSKWYGLGAVPAGGILLLGVAMAMVLSRPHLGATDGVEPVRGWIETASRALMTAAAGAGVFAVALVLDMVVQEDLVATTFVVASLTAAVSGLCVYASTLPVFGPAKRPLMLGIVSAIVLIGLLNMGLLNSEDVGAGSWYAVTGWLAAAVVTLPALAAYALVVPAPVRAAFGPLVSAPAPAPATAPRPDGT